MSNINPMQFAMNMLQNNPQIMNNPQAQGLMQVIQSGDAAKGQQMAENLCKTYGVTPDQALEEARKFFHI
nr:MAG TPA: protein of unknown function DUF4777 [Caudoviricetes sp.]DAV14963.1 MAG TPA: protein of unknown function (DUF4777) [Caudoviricetes sp.]